MKVGDMTKEFAEQEERDGSPALIDLPWLRIKFQLGPVKEFGENGCQVPEILNILIDRLNALNDGLYRCRETSLVITKLEEALLWERRRTELRARRKVEGTSKP